MKDKESKVSPQGTYKVKNLISETSVSLYLTTKRISEIYLLELKNEVI